MIKYQDIFDPELERSGSANFDELLKKHVNHTAKCYEIKPKVDFNNTEIIYTKRYYLPALFNRFYTVQIERFTKSIQREFDEMEKQNTFFNERVNDLFEQARIDMQTYDHDSQYIDKITTYVTNAKRYAERIQHEMQRKFQEKQNVIHNYGNNQFQEIYEYKVNLYIYNTEATNQEKQKYPQLHHTESDK